MIATSAIIVALGQSAAPGAAPDFGDAAELRPLPELPGQLRSPMPSLPPRGRFAPGEAEPPQPRRGLWPNGDGTFTGYLPGIVAHVDEQGRVFFSDEEAVSADPQLGRYGAAGVIGSFVGLNAIDDSDPNRLAKQRFLARTFEVRLAMRGEHGAEVMEAALRDLPRYLAAIWYHDAWPVDIRKRILFELWDECAEHGNDYVAAGGDAARAIIEDFVNRYLPPDAPAAFTAEELRALNSERMSWAVFEPYGERL